MRSVALGVLVSSLACSSLETFPHPACLYDAARLSWRAGSVVTERGDGAKLFRFDDQSEGDHGFMWVAEDDSAHNIGPCRGSALFGGVR